MKYLACYHDIYGDHPDKREYFEIGGDDYATRQVSVFPHAVVPSRKDYDPLTCETLCDQPFSTCDQTGLIEISKDEFEAAWNRPDPREAGRNRD